MSFQPPPGKPSQTRAEAQFKTKKKVNAETDVNAVTARQVEAEKTARLRALRLAKEAADKEAANRDAAVTKAPRSRARRRNPGPQAEKRPI